MRLVTLALGLLLACSRPNAGALPSDAKITVKEGHADVIVGDRRDALPDGDLLALDPRPPAVTQDETGRRFAYPTARGTDRLVFLVGDGLFSGPLVPRPVDLRASPRLDAVLGSLFEEAKARRSELVREVRRELGGAGVVRLLAQSIAIDAFEWEDARRDLSAEEAGALATALAEGLAPGAPPVTVRRAAATLDLRDASRAKLVAEQARSLAKTGREPRTVAVLLRATIARDPALAAEIGCDVLASKPNADAEHAFALEAATLALAFSSAECKDPKLVEALLGDACLPYFRCSDHGPVGWRDASKQDEPLCTKQELATVVASELARTTRDVLDGTTARAPLFAYAALLAKDAVPKAFLVAHARRRYALAQPATPSCDDGLAIGTACHCDEATVRVSACQKPTSDRIDVGLCRFDVDDAKKKLSGIVATPPP